MFSLKRKLQDANLFLEVPLTEDSGALKMGLIGRSEVRERSFYLFLFIISHYLVFM